MSDTPTMIHYPNNVESLPANIDGIASPILQENVQYLFSLLIPAIFRKTLTYEVYVYTHLLRLHLSNEVELCRGR